MSDQVRRAQVQRQTAETQIELEFSLDGTGQAQVETGMGFFDHLLTAFARHGGFDLKVSAQGDLEVDPHHTVEDTGICLGQAIAQALGDKAGVQRFGHSYVPMDEVLARAVVDLAGRSFLVMEAGFQGFQVGDFPVSLAREFFRGLVDRARLALHLDLLRGGNDHHALEALFKAFGRALGQAAQRSERVQGIPSTKGSL